MTPEYHWWLSWLAPYRGDLARVAVLLPVALAALLALTGVRRWRGQPAGRAWGRSLCEVMIVLGTAPFILLTLQPGSENGRVGAVSLVPFEDLQTMPTYQVVGNLAVFAAVGFFGPLRFAALRSVPRVLAVAALGSIAIETAQFALRIDRVSSVDDVLLNTAGAGLAALLAAPGWARARIRRPALEC